MKIILKKPHDNGWYALMAIAVFIGLMGLSGLIGGKQAATMVATAGLIIIPTIGFLLVVYWLLSEVIDIEK